MDNKDFIPKLRSAIGALTDSAASELSGKDREYLANSEISDKAEVAYMALDLTTEQRGVCDKLIGARERADMDYAYYAYLAGFGDGLRTVAYMAPEALQNQQLEKILKSILEEN